MSTDFKNDNKTKELNNYGMPDSFFDSYFVISPDCTKEKDYISTYQMY